MTIRLFRQSLVARNASWMLAGQAFVLLSQAAYFLILARVLGSGQYGIFVGASAAIGIIGNFSALGSGMVLLRYVSADRSRFSVYWGNAICTTVFGGSIATVCIALFGSRLLGIRAPAMLIMVAAGDCIFSKLGDCAGQAFQAVERLCPAAILSALNSLLRLSAAGILWLSLGHANATNWVFAALIVSALGAAVGIFMVSIQLGFPTFDPKLLLTSMREGFGFSVAYSTTSIYNDLDKAMLTRYGMYAANGVYSVAYKLIEISCIPIRSLHAASLPRFFQRGTQGVQATRICAARILSRTFPYAIVAAIGLLLGAPLAPTVLGASFTKSVSALRWLCLIPVFRTLHLSSGDAITAAGHQRYRTSSQIAAALLNLGLNLLLIPSFSWKGAAWASLLTDGALAAANWMALWWLARRKVTATKSATCQVVAA